MRPSHIYIAGINECIRERALLHVGRPNLVSQLVRARLDELFVLILRRRLRRGGRNLLLNVA